MFNLIKLLTILKFHGNNYAVNMPVVEKDNDDDDEDSGNYSNNKSSKCKCAYCGKWMTEEQYDDHLTYCSCPYKKSCVKTVGLNIE